MKKRPQLTFAEYTPAPIRSVSHCVTNICEVASTPQQQRNPVPEKPPLQTTIVNIDHGNECIPKFLEMKKQFDALSKENQKCIKEKVACHNNLEALKRTVQINEEESQQKINELQQKVAKYKKEIDDNVSTMFTCNTSKKELEEKIRKLEQQIKDNHQINLEDWEKLRNTEAYIKTQLEEYKAQFEANEHRKDLVAKQINSLQEQLQSANNQISVEQNTIEELNSKIQKLEARIAHTTGTAEDFDNALQSKIVEFEKLKEDYDNITSELNDAHANLAEKQKAIEACDASLLILKRERDEKDAEIDRLIRDNTQKTQDLENLDRTESQRIQDLKSEKDELMNKFQKLSRSKQELEEQKQELQTKLNKLNENQDKDLTRLNNEKQILEAQLEQLKEAQNRNEEGFKREKMQFEAKIEELNRTLEANKAEHIDSIEKLDAEVERLNDVNKSYEHNQNEKEANIKQLEREKEQLQAEKVQLERNIDDLNQLLDVAKNAKNADMLKLEQEKQQITAHKETLEKDLENLKKLLEDTKKSQKNKINRFEEEKKKLEKTQATNCKTIRDLQRQLQNATNNQSAEAVTLMQQKTELEAQVGELNKEIADLTNKLQSSQGEKDDTIRRLEFAKNNLEDELATVQAQSITLQQELDNHKEQKKLTVDQLEDTKRKLDLRVKNLSEETIRLNRELTLTKSNEEYATEQFRKIMNDKIALEQEVNKIEGLNKELAKLRSQLSSVDQASPRLAQLESEKAQLTQHVASLKHEMELHKAEYNKMFKAGQQLEQELHSRTNTYNQRLGEFNDHIENLQAICGRLQESKDNDQVQFQEIIRHIQEQANQQRQYGIVYLKTNNVFNIQNNIQNIAELNQTANYNTQQNIAELNPTVNYNLHQENNAYIGNAAAAAGPPNHAQLLQMEEVPREGIVTIYEGLSAFLLKYEVKVDNNCAWTDEIIKHYKEYVNYLGSAEFTYTEKMLKTCSFFLRPTPEAWWRNCKGFAENPVSKNLYGDSLGLIAFNNLNIGRAENGIVYIYVPLMKDVKAHFRTVLYLCGQRDLIKFAAFDHIDPTVQIRILSYAGIVTLVGDVPAAVSRQLAEEQNTITNRRWNKITPLLLNHLWITAAEESLPNTTPSITAPTIEDVEETLRNEPMLLTMRHQLLQHQQQQQQQQLPPPQQVENLLKESLLGPLGSLENMRPIVIPSTSTQQYSEEDMQIVPAEAQLVQPQESFVRTEQVSLIPPVTPQAITAFPPQPPKKR